MGSNENRQRTTVQQGATTYTAPIQVAEPVTTIATMEVDITALRKARSEVERLDAEWITLERARTESLSARARAVDALRAEEARILAMLGR